MFHDLNRKFTQGVALKSLHHFVNRLHYVLNLGTDPIDKEPCITSHFTGAGCEHSLLHACFIHI